MKFVRFGNLAATDYKGLLKATAESAESDDGSFAAAMNSYHKPPARDSMVGRRNGQGLSGTIRFCLNYLSAEVKP